jgi:hypothetical protein
MNENVENTGTPEIVTPIQEEQKEKPFLQENPFPPSPLQGETVESEPAITKEGLDEIIQEIKEPQPNIVDGHMVIDEVPVIPVTPIEELKNLEKEKVNDIQDTQTLQMNTEVPLVKGKTPGVNLGDVKYVEIAKIIGQCNSTYGCGMLMEGNILSNCDDFNDTNRIMRELKEWYPTLKFNELPDGSYELLFI